MGQISEKAAVLQQFEELVSSKRVITDVNTIQFYEDALELILPKPGDSWARIIGYLRWEFVKASPKDEEASKACFRACLSKQDYEHARHVSICILPRQGLMLLTSLDRQ
jgi:N-terminal acetyltransferase B complex non-catalytic subunit